MIFPLMKRVIKALFHIQKYNFQQKMLTLQVENDIDYKGTKK